LLALAEPWLAEPWLAEPWLADATAGFAETGETQLRFGEFGHAAKNWTVERRVITRVEHDRLGATSHCGLAAGHLAAIKSVRRTTAPTRGQSQRFRVNQSPRLASGALSGSSLLVTPTFMRHRPKSAISSPFPLSGVISGGSA
jgi:hypothetical protein